MAENTAKYTEFDRVKAGVKMADYKVETFTQEEFIETIKADDSFYDFLVNVAFRVRVRAVHPNGFTGNLSDAVHSEGGGGKFVFVALAQFKRDLSGVLAKMPDIEQLKYFKKPKCLLELYDVVGKVATLKPEVVKQYKKK